MLLLLCFAVLPNAARAACSNPAGSEKAIKFNVDEGVLQYCNDTDWVAMGPPPSMLGPGLPQDGLVGWWKFDEGNGTSAADSSGSGNSGTLENGPVWIAGQINGGLEFDGADDVVNAGSGASLDDLGALTISAWIKPNTVGEGSGKVIWKGSGATESIIFELDSSAPELNALQFIVDYSDPNNLIRTTTNNVVIYGSWQHVTVTWDGSNTATNAKIYINGVETSYSGGNTQNGTLPRISDAAFNLFIGNTDSLGQTFDGALDDVRVYNRALTAVEIAQCCAASASLNAGLVGRWTLDETSGTNAADSSGNGNDGTLTNGPVWSDGKIGGGLNFDGANDYVTMGHPAGGELDFGTNGNFTLSAWIKAAPTQTSSNVFIANKWPAAAQPGYELIIRNSSKVRGGINDGVGSKLIDSTATVTDNSWHHVTYVVNRTLQTHSIYVDGILENSVDITGVGDISNASHFMLGKQSGASANYFTGVIDDVRIYNRALSADEVKMLYNIRNPGTLRYNASYRVPEFFNGEQWRPMGPVKAAPSSGLVGWWKLDETSGTIAADSSGSNNGTLQGGTAWTSGKVGAGALSFDGADDYVSLGVNIAGDLGDTHSVSAWVKTTKAAEQVVLSEYESAVCGDVMFGTTGTGTILWHDGGGGTLTGATPVNDGVWHHLVAVSDISESRVYMDGVLDNSGGDVDWRNNCSAQDTRIGIRHDGSKDFLGLIDDVRIYKRALSPAEVQDLYLAGVPALDIRDGLVSHWKLDESGNVSIATDSSGNGNDGALNGFPADPSASWVDGQVDGGLEFDGVDDSVNTGTGPPYDLSVYTVCAWIYPRSGTDGRITTRAAGTGIGGAQLLGWTPTEVMLRESNTTPTIFRARIDGIKLNEWQHVCGRYDDAGDRKLYLFLNGVEGNYNLQDTVTGTLLEEPGNSFYIGGNSDATRPFDGSIDDVRIYSRALSAEEISQLYHYSVRRCANPERPEGKIVYHEDFNVMQYCDGVVWRKAGK